MRMSKRKELYRLMFGMIEFSFMRFSYLASTECLENTLLDSNLASLPSQARDPCDLVLLFLDVIHVYE